MKIAILGAGAMGCIYGGFLAECAENQVTLIDIREDHLAAIASRGLIIETPEGRKIIKNLRVALNVSDFTPVDLLIVLVKAPDTEAAISRAAGLIKRDTMVLTLQNGLGNVEIISRAVGGRHVLAGVTSFGAFISGPGQVELKGRGEVIIGEPAGGETARLFKLQDLFNKSNLPAKITANVLGAVWAKLIVNVGINAIASILGCPNGRLLENPEALALAEAAVNEAARVARARGIGLETPDPWAHTKSVIQNTGENICSMLQDVLAKRPTEIEVMNAAVARAGRELGLVTPVNDILSRLIRAIEKNY